jgi:hypothetical protein
MPLTVSVRKNTLVGRNRNYRFHSSCEARVGCDELMNIMSRSRTTLSKPDIIACMKLLTETISALVADGNFVKTPLGDFYLCAVGTGDQPDDPFTPDNERSGHGVRLRGCRLAFDQSDERLGLFLIPGSDAKGPGSRCSIYASVAPSLIILQPAPSLEPGDYALAVRTATTTGTLREVRLEEVVRVSAAHE